MLTRSRFARMAVVATVAALAVAGCGSDDEGGGSGSSGEAKKDLTVGYVSYSAQVKIQQDVAAGMEEQGKKYGYKTKVVDAGGDVGKANSLMRTLVTQKVDAIVFDSFGDKAMQAGIQAAKAAKIPVYAAYNWGKPTDVAASILLAAPEEQTNRMIEDLGDKGSVLAFTLPAGDNCVNGEKIFDEIMKEHPNIKVDKHATKAPGWQEDSASATKAWLKSHPKGEPLAIWGCWDGPAVGATAALAEEGRDDVKVYGDYGEADAINAIKAKKYTATYYFDARKLGATIVDLVKKHSAVPYEEIETEYVEFPPIEVDQENVDQFLQDHPEAVQGS